MIVSYVEDSVVYDVTDANGAAQFLNDVARSVSQEQIPAFFSEIFQAAKARGAFVDNIVRAVPRENLLPFVDDVIAAAKRHRRGAADSHRVSGSLVELLDKIRGGRR